jgi:lysophospholipase L1-like esterase
MQIKLDKFFNLFCLLSASFILLMSCDRSGTLEYSGNNTSTTSKIIVLSDSIGTGYGEAIPFPERIRDILDVELISNSVNGRQTSGGLAILKMQLELHKPSHLLVLLGTNDAQFGSVEAALSNLQDIVNIANDSGVFTVVGTLPPYPLSEQGNDLVNCISIGIREQLQQLPMYSGRGSLSEIVSYRE